MGGGADEVLMDGAVVVVVAVAVGSGLTVA